jgi:hypothetical protein
VPRVRAEEDGREGEVKSEEEKEEEKEEERKRIGHGVPCPTG